MTDPNPVRRWAQEAEGRDPDESGPDVPDAMPAATVILVRDTTEGIETLMLRRNSKLAFAGGMWVFPGGRVDDDDRSADDADELAAARRAAAREAQEEAGLIVDPEGLITFSHWEPPAIAPKRFSTWFFMAAAPEGAIEIDGGEIHDHGWMRPSDALARRDAFELELSPPTWVTLFELAKFADVDAAFDAVKAWEPERFTTHVSLVDDGVVALWHGDAGYDSSVAAVDGPRHRLWMVDGGWRYERS
jgi:8-oxo-dGTP pyrophosphatase MutT (NUDIX family)